MAVRHQRCPWLCAVTLVSAAVCIRAQSIDAVVEGPSRPQPAVSLLRPASWALATTGSSADETAYVLDVDGAGGTASSADESASVIELQASSTTTAITTPAAPSTTGGEVGPSTGPGASTDNGTAADGGDTPDDFDHFNALRLVGIVLASIFITLLLSTLTFGYVFGRAVKYAIESLDQDLLGVQITVDKVVISVGFGFFHLSGLAVQNPEHPGGAWATDYLAKMESVTVDVNMTRLICSCGGTLEVNQVEMANIHVAYCKPSLTEKSNVQLVLDALGAEDASTVDSDDAAAAAAGGGGGGTALILQQLCLKSVGAAVYFYDKSIKMDLADVNVNDFEQVQKNGRLHMARWVVSLVLRTLCRSAVDNCETVLASQTVGRAEAAVGRAEAAVESSAQQVGAWMGAHNPFASGGEVEMAET